MKKFNTDQNQFSKKRIIAGAFIAGYGVLLLLSKITMAIPAWIFTWPVLLIALGLFTGLKHNFRNSSWIVLMLVGGFFLADNILKITTLHAFIVPTLIIAAGILILVRPAAKRNHCYMRHHYRNMKNTFEKTEA